MSLLQPTFDTCTCACTMTKSKTCFTSSKKYLSSSGKRHCQTSTTAHCTTRPSQRTKRLTVSIIMSSSSRIMKHKLLRNCPCLIKCLKSTSRRTKLRLRLARNRRSMCVSKSFSARSTSRMLVSNRSAWCTARWACQGRPPA